jgi:hypothetical protein
MEIKLFVGNLSISTTLQLQELFERDGTINLPL